MFPVHTWLPDAHVEAPTGGSMVLAAITLKLGAYGFLRFILPIMPDAARYFAPVIIVLSLIAVDLYRYGGFGANRYEKTGGVLFHQPYGFCHFGYVPVCERPAE